ncbi:MAG: glycerol-3-phosphate 1-O-acyltransferase PlsY [Clostridia bacterium]|nr:glycerol-3-phosphate 1-O-acyltransferase PlsY [Clostridia bacterium]
MILFYIFVFILSYFIAAINPAILLSKKVLKQDIRELGSNNAGTTNAIRTMGKKWGALVFVLDVLKVVTSFVISFLVAKIFNIPFNNIAKSLFMLASIMGHVFPIYYSFKGGKGVATYLTSALLIDYRAALVCIVVGILLILITRWVSLGSICGTFLLVIITMFMDTNFNVLITAMATVLVIYKHKTNIVKILNGKENKLF